MKISHQTKVNIFSVLFALTFGCLFGALCLVTIQDSVERGSVVPIIGPAQIVRCHYENEISINMLPGEGIPPTTLVPSKWVITFRIDDQEDCLKVDRETCQIPIGTFLMVKYGYKQKNGRLVIQKIVTQTSARREP